MRVMGDSTNLLKIPTTVDMVAVYRNGDWPADPAVVAARFPPKRKVAVWIDVTGADASSCQILDVESGDAPVAAAPGWIRRRAAAVHSSLPTIYCNRSTYPNLIVACQHSGLQAGKHYQLGISTLDGTQSMNGRLLMTYAGVVFCQYHGGVTAPYDLSAVYDDKWHPLG